MTRTRATLLVVARRSAATARRARRTNVGRSSRSSSRRATASRRPSSTSGTFGFLPGVPSAYTQPLYAFFLAALYWPLGASGWSSAWRRSRVAVATAARRARDRPAVRVARRRRRRRADRDAPPVPRLARRPRQPRDPRRVPARAARAALPRWPTSARSRLLAAAVGRRAGLAILSNARLVCCRSSLAAYVAWQSGRARTSRAAPLLVARRCDRGVTPVGRAQPGRRSAASTITTDARALWKANNREHPRRARATGGWIDDVPDLPSVAALAGAGRGDLTSAARRRRSTSARRCASTGTRCWTSGATTRARRRASPPQAVGMLWRRRSAVAADDPGSRASRDRRATHGRARVHVGRSTCSRCGARSSRPAASSRWSLLLVGTNTAMAMVFAGTTRYRAPLDFLLALLAAFALERALGAGHVAAPPRPARSSAAR